jgi:hypothetical protein
MAGGNAFPRNSSTTRAPLSCGARPATQDGDAARAQCRNAQSDSGSLVTTSVVKMREEVLNPLAMQSMLSESP